MTRNRIYRMTRAVSFSISLLSICIPAPFAISPSPSPSRLSLPLSTESFLCPLCSPLLSFLALSFPPYAKFLRTLVAERERVYRSIAERPRSRLLLLLEVRSRRAGFFLPSLPSARFSLLFLATRRGSTRCGQHPSVAATPRAACRSSTRCRAAPRRAPVHVSLTSWMPRE